MYEPSCNLYYFCIINNNGGNYNNNSIGIEVHLALSILSGENILFPQKFIFLCPFFLIDSAHFKERLYIYVHIL